MRHYQIQIENVVTRMDQTPAHEQHNEDLLAFIPTDAKKVVEVGCSSGALAREYKKINKDAYYIGIEISAEYAKLAARYCDDVMLVDIERNIDNILPQASDCDCWVFGDSLEHLKNPWAVLKTIRETIPKNGCVVACIPNAQHWSLQVSLNRGEFRYEESGLLDKTHLRWFTRITILELFSSTGFKIIKGAPRVFNEPHRDRFLPAIKLMAELSGANPTIAVSDCLPLQYVIHAIPA